MPKPTKSSQKLLPRKPRVQIEYDVEVGGTPRKTELPWVTGVMADLSGDNAGSLRDMGDRSFADVDAENFDAFLKSQTPRVTFAVENLITGEGRMGVDVTFEKLDDFTPDQFARKIGAEIEEVKVTRIKEGRAEHFQIAQQGPVSLALGETCDSLDKLASPDFVGMKLGEKPGDLEVVLIPDAKDPTKNTLRVVRKGHLAKLLDARNQLKELLIKVDGKSGVQKALDEMLSDPSLMRQIVDGNQEAP